MRGVHAESILSKSYFRNEKKLKNNEKDDHRKLSLLGGWDETNCELKKVENHLVEPIHVVSYPGSGGRFLLTSIEALTGIKVIGDGHLNAVSDPPPKPFNYLAYFSQEMAYGNYFSKVVILMRTPLKVIPSFCDILYQKTSNETESDNYAQCPEDVWLKFRDERFEDELRRWKYTLEYWLDRYDPAHRLMISYERLTDDYVGPLETLRLARFLNTTYSVETHAPEDVACVWTKISTNNDLRETRPHGDETARFTISQLNRMTEVLDELVVKYLDMDFVDLFYDYEKFIDRLRIKMIGEELSLAEKYLPQFITRMIEDNE